MMLWETCVKYNPVTSHSNFILYKLMRFLPLVPAASKYANEALLMFLLQPMTYLHMDPTGYSSWGIIVPCPPQWIICLFTQPSPHPTSLSVYFSAPFTISPTLPPPWPSAQYSYHTMTKQESQKCMWCSFIWIWCIYVKFPIMFAFPM